MGLRFRKSISIIPGVKLNFGKTGMSVSAGVPGFRKTFHTSGKVTTSVGLPGTGIYYVDTKNSHANNSQRNTRANQVGTPTDFNYSANTVQDETDKEYTPYKVTPEDTMNNPSAVPQIDSSVLKSIHKTADDSVDWTEVLVSPLAPDDSYNQTMWEYYHTMAPKILSGDIDSYLQLIYEVNPLDDLLAYGSGFEFGTDDPKKIEVEFTVNEMSLRNVRKTLSQKEYNDLLQDFVCSVCIRVARDMFALLPVYNTVVHAVLNGQTVLSVNFDRKTLSAIKFGYIDPSDTMEKFVHNMTFSKKDGFVSVDRIS